MKSTKNIILNAYFEAKKRKHEYMCLEHLLFVLLEEKEVAMLVEYCQGDISYAKKQIDKFLTEQISTIKKGDPIQTKSMLKLLDRLLSSGEDKANSIVEWLNQNSFLNEKVNDIFIEDSLALLFLILLEKDSHATYLLNSVNVDKVKMVKYLTYLNHDKKNITHLNTKVKNNKPLKTLEQYSININKKVKDQSIDPLIGRQVEIERLSQILCRRKKNNPILVGEPGVGKSAIVEGLAYNIHHKKIHFTLQNIVIYSINLGDLLAGTRYRGDFEQRIKDILDEISSNPNIILFIDEIHNIIGAGSSYSGTLDAGNILKPSLANGNFRCIGATTYKEYQNIFEKDAALSRRFQKIDVVEPSPDESMKILRGIKKGYEDFYGIVYKEDALKTCIQLACQYIGNKHLPDKAIDILDEAGASFMLSNAKETKEVTKEIIEDTMRNMGFLPKEKSKNDKQRLKDLKSELKKRIYGQDEAIIKLISYIKSSKAGFKENKPIGSFLFSGTTGVGKTELSEQIADILQMKFVRFDMSEYMEKHSVARLIGAPPGYVGFEQRGLLTEQIQKNPHCVLLLDEIEKAHSDIYNILLQVMDNATLTDNFGVKVDFQYTILIMTSNIGTQNRGTEFIGFGNKNITQEQQAVRKEFRPEFLNRLSAIIHFNTLAEKDILKIVNKHLKKLSINLLDRGIIFSADSNAKKWLMKKGYNSQLGARPIERLIQEEIKDKLAEEILFGDLQEGGKVNLSTKKKTLHFSIQSLVE